MALKRTVLGLGTWDRQTGGKTDGQQFRLIAHTLVESA